MLQGFQRCGGLRKVRCAHPISREAASIISCPFASIYDMVVYVLVMKSGKYFWLLLEELNHSYQK